LQVLNLFQTVVNSFLPSLFYVVILNTVKDPRTSLLCFACSSIHLIRANPAVKPLEGFDYIARVSLIWSWAFYCLSEREVWFVSSIRILRRLRYVGLVLGWIAFAGLAAGAALAQVGGNSGAGIPIAPSSTPASVYGQVINASTGLPIPRALVRMNTRAVLTDHEGKFRFEQNTDSSANMLVTKPGFFFTTEYGDPGNIYLQGAQLAAPQQLRLYPEALLTGTVLGTDGSPLARIPVTALREVFDDEGRRWIGVAQAATDGHGDFRLPLPAGAYRLETRYVPRNASTAEAILPISIPGNTSSDTSQNIRLRSGEEQYFELRPLMGRTHVVAVIMRGSSVERGFARITARSSSGSQLQTNAMPDNESGGMRLELPQGT
jgi:hypothetical protein